MTTGFLPILLFAGLVTAFVVLSLAASSLVRPHRPNPAKTSPYECGITPERLPSTERFPVKFYVVAMLFIIFDIETIFLYPWAVTLRALGLFGLVEMIVFIGLVFVAYVFVFQKGGLEWEGPTSTGRAAVDGGTPAARLASLGSAAGGLPAYAPPAPAAGPPAQAGGRLESEGED
jgi:NADH-quinone oxidoreductase subunit A